MARPRRSHSSAYMPRGAKKLDRLPRRRRRCGSNGALRGGGYAGIPPPPRGLPPPTRPYFQHFSAGMPGGGPPGSRSKAGADGGGFNTVAWTSPNPLVTVDRTTPAATTAAAVKCFGFIVRVPFRTRTTLVTSCLVGYAEDHQQRTRHYRLAVELLRTSVYMWRAPIARITRIENAQAWSQREPEGDQP